MNIHLCDFCKGHISNDAEVMIAIVVTKRGDYGPVPAAQLDVCVPCATAKGLVMPKPELVPNRGALTAEEIDALARGATS